MPASPDSIDVEGLGPFGLRTFLDSTLGALAPGPGRVSAAPNTVWAARAGELAEQAAQGGDGNAWALPEGTVSTPGAGLFVSRDGEGWTPARAEAARAVRFDAQERDLPPVAGQAIRVADAWVFHVEHWSELLWANLLALGPALWAQLVSPGAVAWSVLRAGSTAPDRLARHLVRQGRGCRVHPNATVEFSVLGEGVVVGPGAVVRGAILGAGAEVEALACVEACVLGVGARIQRQAMAKYSLLEAGARHAGVIQLGVLGAEAQVRQGAVLFDQTLGQSATIERRGVLEPAPRGMIGVCVGAGAVIGQGVRIAPGRAIPAGLTVLGNPDDVLRSARVPPGVVQAAVRNGRLEPQS